MLLAALTLAQATPLGVAERDAREFEAMLLGQWNNAEAVYFAGELGADAPPSGKLTASRAANGEIVVRWTDRGRETKTLIALEPTALGVDATLIREGIVCEGSLYRLGDSFSLSFWLADGDARVSGCPVTGKPYHADPITVTPDALRWSALGTLHRADPYACWVSRKRDEGTEDNWTWTPDITVREGEYVQLPDDPAARRPVGLKLRHVRWPYGRNRDSLVLYVHEAEDDPAVSYAWTEPDAGRIAVNLRWVQASCTREEGYEP